MGCGATPVHPINNNVKNITLPSYTVGIELVGLNPEDYLLFVIYYYGFSILCKGQGPFTDPYRGLFRSLTNQ